MRKTIEPKTITVTIPNPRCTKQFDHYLFWFVGSAEGEIGHICAALPKDSSKEDVEDAAREWAYANFPHSACDEGRHKWRKIKLLPRKQILELHTKAYKRARSAKLKLDEIKAMLNPRAI